MVLGMVGFFVKLIFIVRSSLLAVSLLRASASLPRSDRLIAVQPINSIIIGG